MGHNNNNRSDKVNRKTITSAMVGGPTVELVRGTPTGPRSKPAQAILDKLRENVQAEVDRRWPKGPDGKSRRPSNDKLGELLDLNEASISQVLRGVEKDWQLTTLLAFREFTQLSLDELLGLPQTESMIERAVRRALEKRTPTPPPVSSERPSKRPGPHRK